jgi:hypothetical protein
LNGLVRLSHQVLEVGTHKELLNKPDGVFAAMWQAQIQTDTEEEDAGVDGQKVIDDKFDQIEAQADTAIKEAHPVNGQATKSGSRHKNQASSPDESHADPFTVDIEKGAGSSNQAVRSEHVGVQNGNIPATLEDVSSPPILDEGDADEGEPLLAMPDKSSNKRNAAITSGSSKNVHVPSGSSERSHSVSDHPDLEDSMLLITAFPLSTVSSLVTGRPQGMIRGDATDIASIIL